MSYTAVKIILLGESGVGKSSLLLRFKTGVFREKLSMTFIDHHVKNIQIKDKLVKLSIWDTAGQEKFRSFVSSYYRGADGVLLVYDVTDVTTFHTLSKWLCDLRQHNEDAQVVIAGNKNEDPTAKSVAVSTVKNYCRDESLEYVEVSAKSGENVEMVFESLAEKILIAKGILPPPEISPAAPEQKFEKSQTPSAERVKTTSPSVIPQRPPRQVSIPTQIRNSSANDKIILHHQMSISSPKKKKKCC